MNRPPEIFINSGYGADNSGNLVGLTIPDTVSVLKVPSSVTFLGESISWTASLNTVLKYFDAPNAISVSGNLFSGYTALTILKLNSLASIVSSQSQLCSGCSALTTAEFDSLTSMSILGDDKSTFNNCSSLTNISLPKLQTVQLNNYRVAVFRNCGALETLDLPYFIACYNANNINSGLANTCAGLKTVTLGSIGHAVTSLSSYTFANCTQSGLTITVYTQGGAALAGEPWGATNADVIYEEA